MNRYRILLVEDERVMALDTQRRLQRLGHELIGVERTGEAAVQAVRRSPPDAVLMDIVLEGAMDGVAAAEIIRKHHPVPVIYLTADANEETLARARVTEPYGYLVKPVTNRDLLITLELAVYRHRAERERQALQDRLSRLEGIIPICSSCKKLRNDAGAWQELEAYFTQRTDAKFSHGLCMDCQHQLYPPEQYPFLYDGS